MKRWIWRTLWISSLLLAVVVGVLWVRSHFRGDLFLRGDHLIVARNDFLRREWLIRSNFGRLYLARNWEWDHPETPNPELEDLEGLAAFFSRAASQLLATRIPAVECTETALSRAHARLRPADHLHGTPQRLLRLG